MKKLITLVVVLTCAAITNASYTYEVYTYSPSKVLYGTETILIDLQGGMNGLDLGDMSIGTVQGTSKLEQGIGGIWELNVFNNSFIEFFDGEVNEIDLANDATAVLHGGLIENIKSTQNAWKWDNSIPPALIPNPHITIVYSGGLPFWDSSTNILTGLWGNGDPFAIQLIDVQGYSPAIENIQFEIIPEPASLLLLGLGGLLLRKRVRV